MPSCTHARARVHTHTHTHTILQLLTLSPHPSPPQSLNNHISQWSLKTSATKNQTNQTNKKQQQQQKTELHYTNDNGQDPLSTGHNMWLSLCENWCSGKPHTMMTMLSVSFKLAIIINIFSNLPMVSSLLSLGFCPRFDRVIIMTSHFTVCFFSPYH